MTWQVSTTTRLLAVTSVIVAALAVTVLTQQVDSTVAGAPFWFARHVATVF
jgi:hypothetical protein